MRYTKRNKSYLHHEKCNHIFGSLISLVFLAPHLYSHHPYLLVIRFDEYSARSCRSSSTHQTHWPWCHEHQPPHQLMRWWFLLYVLYVIIIKNDSGQKFAATISLFSISPRNNQRAKTPEGSGERGKGMEEDLSDRDECNLRESELFSSFPCFSPFS